MAKKTMSKKTKGYQKVYYFNVTFLESNVSIQEYFSLNRDTCISRLMDSEPVYKIVYDYGDNVYKVLDFKGRYSIWFLKTDLLF